MEIRALHAANLLAPVLDAISAGLEALEVEHERWARPSVETRLRERLANGDLGGSMAEKLGPIHERLRTKEQEARETSARALVRKRSKAFGMLKRYSNYKRQDILQVIALEIAEKLHLARINRN